MDNELNELKARYERLKSLYQVGSVIHSTLEPQPALLLIVREAARLIQYQQSYQAAAKILQVAQTIFDTLLDAS